MEKGLAMGLSLRLYSLNGNKCSRNYTGILNIIVPLRAGQQDLRSLVKTRNLGKILPSLSKGWHRVGVHAGGEVRAKCWSVLLTEITARTGSGALCKVFGCAGM